MAIYALKKRLRNRVKQFFSTLDASDVVVGRYLRIYITDTVSGDAFATMWEVEVRAAGAGADLTSPGMTTAASSAFDVRTSGKAIDNNVSSDNNSWCANGSLPAWWYVDLGSSQLIAEIAITCGPAGTGTNRAPKNFRIEVSEDGVNWTTVRTVTGETSWTGLETKLFAVPA